MTVIIYLPLINKIPESLTSPFSKGHPRCNQVLRISNIFWNRENVECGEKIICHWRRWPIRDGPNGRSGIAEATATGTRTFSNNKLPIQRRALRVMDDCPSAKRNAPHAALPVTDPDQPVQMLVLSNYCRCGFWNSYRFAIRHDGHNPAFLTYIIITCTRSQARIQRHVMMIIEISWRTDEGSQIGDCDSLWSETAGLLSTYSP